MKRAIGLLIVALVLAGAGVLAWRLGQSERELADLHTAVMTLQFAAAAERAGSATPTTDVAGLLGLTGGARVSPRDERATAEYWLGRYDRFAAERAKTDAADLDSHERLLASNAAYRAAQGASRQDGLKRLEDVIKSYAEVLKADPDAADAAYNYEFVVRARNVLARPAATTPPASVADAAATTIHGRPGAPPKSVNMGAFQVIIPKHSDERQEAPEAGKGGKKERKG